MERKPKIDPELYDMACVWGFFHKTEEAGNVVQEQNSADSGNNGKLAQQKSTDFADGKKLLGTDLGAKGAMHMDGFSNFGRISRGIRGK